MLPATLAHDVRKQVLHYLEATFHMRDLAVEQALRRFFLDPENGLFKGPWLQLRRPFRLAAGTGEKFFDVPVPFTPFRHQWRAWDRLTSKGQVPRHTLVTTGTGSGKTECFLVPILDHCYREYQAGRRNGIKAIILYPMNALAADQASRFAEEILRSDLLSYDASTDGGKVRKARVRVGLYTGRMQPGQEDHASGTATTFKEVQVIPATSREGKPIFTAITDRAVMQQDPPDILLTNYKMLDYLLLRPKDQAIWRHNSAEPKLLRYLVLDELHTYDGAQGADVACLIRRLKARFGLAKGKVCVVGTSATIAAGGDDETKQDPINRLCHFASTLFEEDIPNDAVIGEDRYRVEEIVRKAEEAPHFARPSACVPGEKETAEVYAYRLAPLYGAPGFPLQPGDRWLAGLHDRARPDESVEDLDLDEGVRWRLALGEWLRAHPLFHALLRVTAEGAVTWTDLIRQLSAEDFSLREVGDFDQRSEVLMGFLALVAQARELRSGRVFPLVPTQVQFWIRELRRIGRVVNADPVFSWLDEPLQERKQLPTVHCTECGESAWVALHDPEQDAIIQQKVRGYALVDDPQLIYEGWGFERSPSRYLVILSPWKEGDEPVTAGGQQELEATRSFLAPTELVVRTGPGPGPLTGEATIPVKVAYETRQLASGNRLVGVKRCPHCQAEDSLMFLGARAATTASVAIDEVFGSILNNDPKLLAFTDSVQDASHRAGFFSARTYHFTFRTALQHVIDEAGSAGMPIEEAGERLLRYWSQDMAGRPGSEREVLATLMPPDLREYVPYLQFRGNPAQESPPASLRRSFIERLNWEAVSEFSLMLTHGRTMELHASATLGWNSMNIEKLVERLRDRLVTISQGLRLVTEDQLTLWILGILHRQRERGALYHPYMDSYARQNYWGKHPFGRVVEGRETLPPAGRYRPRLIVTERDRYHDNYLVASAPGQQVPWQLVWARRILGVPAVSDSELVDLIKAMLEEGARVGVFRNLHSDGNKSWYAIDACLARLYANGEKLACSITGHVLYRPSIEAIRWTDAPSLSYRDNGGHYHLSPLNERENYYRERYRKGALRRVFAYEHTGLLTTEEREALEMSFNAGGHADDPNVLTATSTLEMGIDIGDLSSTLLCSIPPSVASYLQRIGRAGRKTGTALVLAVVNQRPHDLFFFARPDDLLRSDIEPPGVWLDASAVLVRQYLAFCFDTGVKDGRLTDLPVSGRQLVDEVLVAKAGHIPDLLAWMMSSETELQQGFLGRFQHDVFQDTVERFMSESRTEWLRERIEQAAQEFNTQRLLLENARKRLNEQKKKLDADVDAETIEEIEREQKIISARTRKLGEISALEVLIEHGLLPNYAFPERGVRFSGTTYNSYVKRATSGRNANEDTDSSSLAGGESVKSFELVRSAASAIRELAPANHFYTHSHAFEIQQLELGSRSQPLIEEWAVCGRCGHMRLADEVRSPDAVPSCPQCGYDGQGGQTDIGQHRQLLPLQRSQAISYMEYYDSLSADRAEERDSEFYRIAASFDPTLVQSSGAVGNDDLPFGIEYRAAIRLREVNAGYGSQPNVVAFSDNITLPEGFELCEHCGVATTPGQNRANVRHRRSCSGRRQSEQMQREGKPGNAYQWRQVWIYRELRSEAIRLLLPDVVDDDLDTLQACIYLGLRLRFQGNPAHLIVRPQSVPDIQGGITRNYLVLMDAVPGGTGFLKTLYQEQDSSGLEGEGIMDVLRRARDALETCSCRQVHHSHDDTDGCYRCIRTYHLQYRAENISRERGIRLLGDLISAGEQRTVREALGEIKALSLFGSMLEKRFVECLRRWTESRGGQWFDGLVNGSQGFRFVVGGPERSWELELQPLLGPINGVSVACQPDFILRCDDPAVKPVAIFADGFDAHVHPGAPESRLSDDVRKRRAILDSGKYWVWSLSWDDLSEDAETAKVDHLQKHLLERILPPQFQRLMTNHLTPPALNGVAGNPWQQLQAYISAPDERGWRDLARYAAGFSLVLLAGNGIGTDLGSMQEALEHWRLGGDPVPLSQTDRGDWCWIRRFVLSDDLLAYAPIDGDLMANKFERMRLGLRLDDATELRAQSDSYKKRWRCFHALFNFFQFAGALTIFSTSEVHAGEAAELEVSIGVEVSAGWAAVIEAVVPSLVPIAKALSAGSCHIPETEYYDDSVGEELFGELAWPQLRKPIVILVGDQISFAERWQSAGWIVVTEADVNAKGKQWLVERIGRNAGYTE